MNSIKSFQLANEISKRVIIGDRLKKAFEYTDREVFMPKGFSFFTYSLEPLPINAGQWISSPLTVAKMTESLDYEKEDDSVLEIGCGSGYQAAILSKIFRRVFTVERIESLLNEAKKRFEKLNLHNIETRFDDGVNGWKTYAPYDRILFSASCITPPLALMDQLKDGGILVAPIEKDGRQIITRFFKNGKKITSQEIEECFFVPIVGGVQKS